MFKSRYFTLPILLILVVLCKIQAQTATGNLTVSFDFIARGVVTIREQDRTERLEMMIFSSNRQDNYLAIIKSPLFRMGTSFLKKGNTSYLYYPGSNIFINLNKNEQMNPCLPFLYLHFHLSESTDWTMIEKWEKNWPGRIEFTGPEKGDKATIFYSEYTSVDNSWVPLKWQVSATLSRTLDIAVEIKSFTRTTLPEFIFTRAYLQLLCGY